MNRRLNALRTAVIVAAGFVVLRVGYRVVFGGGSGDGLMIADLPRIRLEGPFAHVVLFGPITTGGVTAAALSALPFAGMVLALGLIGVVVDLRALLTRGAIRGPVRTVSRALVVAWGAFPGLVESVRRVRVARELRAERSAASLVVPVLEQTVERAIALGASMEVRGFAATRRVEPVCERPVRMRDAALGFEARWTLTGVDLDLEPGTLTLISGPTGAGKSTLLHALSGVFQHVSQGVQGGVIEVAGVDRLVVPPRETAGFVGVVAQSVRLSFVAATVADEIGFALAMRGVAPVIVRARVSEIAERLQITHLLEREVVALSAGEACLVAIGAAIVAHPVVLLVDEPLADLDADARQRVVAVLDELAHSAGVCVVVAEHAVAEVLPIADRRVVLAHGTAVFGPAVATPAPTPIPIPRATPIPTGPAPSLRGASRPLASESSDPVAVVRDLTVHHGGSRVVDAASLDLDTQQVVALMGPNGAGKSSLLHALARPPRAGVVEIAGRDVFGLRRRARRAAVALVPEAFDDLLFETTVRRELTRADRRADRSAPSSAQQPTSAERFTRLLGFGRVDDAAELLETHPRDLSAGERLCLVLAIQLAAHPTLLLVDEPSRGLDDVARQLVGEALSAAADDGAAVMFATHDREFAERYATRTLAMADARVQEGAVR
jgi:energy-coupling factor transporter ATP-binding protein EcfA2